MLIDHFNISPSFVWAVCQYFIPQGRHSIPDSLPNHLDEFELWFILPVRLQVQCSDKRRGHTESTAGNNQMDPFHYLHLPDAGVDVRGSPIAMFFRFSLVRGTSTILTINFMDGRWSKPATESKRRMKEILDATSAGRESDIYAPLFVQISSVLKWWNNTLTSVHEQLVTCVSVRRN